MRNVSSILVVLLVVLAACQPTEQPAQQAATADNNPIQPKLLVGIDAPPPVPADNPLTPAKIELGRQLFFDARLSVDGSVSCATCHNPVMGFTDGRATSMGVRGQVGGRSAPSVINLAYATNGVFWDGRAASLEDQAKGPIANPIEMSNTHETMVAKSKSSAGV